MLHLSKAIALVGMKCILWRSRLSISPAFHLSADIGTSVLTHLVTDKGPQRQWLVEMGKAEDPSCVCDGRTPQNATHLYQCPWVGDGRGRSREAASMDEKWCEAVARFV